MPVLYWVLEDAAPLSCVSVAVACAPANCPALAGFAGSVDYVDTWDLQQYLQKFWLQHFMFFSRFRGVVLVGERMQGGSSCFCFCCCSCF